MFLRKLETVDAFVVVDLDGVPGSGVVRLAPRVLQNGARDLARSRTYALASLGRRETGLSAGINAQPGQGDEAVAAFVAEVSGWGGDFRLVAGRGVAAGSLGPLEEGPADGLTAAGAVAAGLAALPGARTAAVMGGPDQVATGLAARGVELVGADDPLIANVDLLFCGTKVGAIDHIAAATLGASAVVPTGPLPLTTRAVAECRRRDILALPDFVTTAGPLLGGGGACGPGNWRDHHRRAGPP